MEGLLYSVVYFDCITAFKVLQRKIFAKVGAHTRCVDVSGIHADMCALNVEIWLKYVTE